MNELFRHIGPDTDVPAGDIGVGEREIGYLFGQYKKLVNEFTGVLTGKGINWGGSLIRPEATGYGLVYFAREMLKRKKRDFSGLTCLVSGPGNVAQYTAEKLIQLGARVVTLSDSSGFVYDAAGINEEKLRFVMELKNVRRGRIKEYAEKYNVPYYEGKKPWSVKADAAFPCATQNEIDVKEAEELIKNACLLVAEGANMPCTPEAVEKFQKAGVLFAPGKAANAGGVATSGLEMSQNSMRLAWPREEVDRRLQKIMYSIHETIIKIAADYGFPENYVTGANIAGFIKVADSMLAQGVV